ncbi:MAG TPA: glycosyltransferase family 2 protein, partial [Gammaproteobacteria bacterium]|nr:glycosyltransferase family 2 protein [Gammaproteobacteria bacterium]
MPDTPFFSVIIPSYNHAHYVCEAIDSVLDQTFSDFEIIVVDDGSTDHTRQAIQGYEHPAIHYIYQDNKGLPGARNTGIRHARGRWIALLDADDLWHRERLAHIAEHIRRHP